jgi:hypothetical protein
VHYPHQNNVNAMDHFIVLQYPIKPNCNYFISSVQYPMDTLIISNPTHTCITLVKLMQMHWIILLLCNIHAQDNIFHFILYKNAIVGLFWSYVIPSCLGYISYHLIEQCNILWTHWQYHIQPNSHMHYLHLGDAIPQGQNSNIMSNHTHIYNTLIEVMHIL